MMMLKYLQVIVRTVNGKCVKRVNKSHASDLGVAVRIKSNLYVRYRCRFVFGFQIGLVRRFNRVYVSNKMIA